MAGVERFDARQRVGLCLDAIGEFQQQASAFRGAHARPLRERRLRSGHGAIHVFRLRFGDAREQRCVVRIQDVDRGAVRSGDEIAVDEQAVDEIGL